MAAARELKDDDQKVSLDECNDSLSSWYDGASEHIERGRNFLTFLYVDQWELDIKQARLAIGKPCMQFNKVTAMVRSVLGEQRTNSPSLTVRGVGKKVSQSDIDIKDGLLRQIQYESDADIAYQIARKNAMEVGWGAARVVAEYENPNTFKQRLRIVPIMDFQAAFWDAAAQLPDKSDGNFCGVYTAMDRKQFMKLYPDIENPQSVAPDGTYFITQWSDRDFIVMAEIYIKKWFKKKIVQLSDEKEMSADEAKEVLAKQEEAFSGIANDEMFGYEKLEIVNEREVDDYEIKHVQFIGNKILEEADYKGKILPIPYCQGDSVIIDGETIPIPYIQDAIDNQKLMNYLGSEMAYAVVRARKETIMGTPENFAGFEDEWRNSDQVQGALRYNHDKLAGAPQFITPPVYNESMLNLYQSTNNDLKENLGAFDEARGAETNAQSGAAINARATASKKPVNVYEDNGNRFMRSIGKIVLEMIPHIYDTEREVMIRTQDNKAKPVTINQRQGYRMTESGEIDQNVMNDMSFGEYDVEVRVDGSYDAQMQAAMDTLLKLASINPKIADVIPDLLAENSGLKNTPQLMQRLRTLLPPDILSQEEGKPVPPPQPNPMVEIEHQKIDNERQNIAVNKMKIMQSAQEMQSKEKISQLNTSAALARAQAEVIKAHSEKDQSILDHANKLHEQPKEQTKITYKKRRKFLITHEV